MTKTCLQCGAVLASRAQTCEFCGSSFPTEASTAEVFSSPRAQKNASRRSNVDLSQPVAPCAGVVSGSSDQDSEWRGELARRMETYRLRRRKSGHHVDQSQFAFQDDTEATQNHTVAVAHQRAEAGDDFAFTLAIGRRELKAEQQDRRIEIDVSVPLKSSAVQPDKHRIEDTVESASVQGNGAFPVASLAERRLAALIDLTCLAFAYGGFLALFSSLGGQFTISKLSAAVYGTTIAIVYLQYFALFTIFGGTTPGMMFRGLQVSSFDGDAPTPRQMLLRSFGYMLSAGTFLMGFLWAYWDEDTLTWHDRLSKTYLSIAETFTNESAEAAHPR